MPPCRTTSSSYWSWTWVVWEDLPLARGRPHPQLQPAAPSSWLLHVLTRGFSERERGGLGLRPRERQHAYSGLNRWG